MPPSLRKAYLQRQQRHVFYFRPLVGKIHKRIYIGLLLYVLFICANLVYFDIPQNKKVLKII